MRILGLFGLGALVNADDEVITSRPVTGFEDRDIADVNRDLNLVHGDIMVDQQQQKSTINGDFYRWELPIPVVLSSKANRKTRGEWLEAKKEYELRTCVGMYLYKIERLECSILYFLKFFRIQRLGG